MSVLSVSMSASHSFGKMPTSYIYLLPKLGVQGDAHCGTSPSSNPRQVHLIDSSLFSSLSKPSSKSPSYQLSPGSLGENITTSNLDLLSLGEGTRLHFGDDEGHAVVRISGIRQPRKRLDEWPEGLLERCAKKGKKIGVYATVEKEGYVQPGSAVYVESPKHFKPLGYV
ncbi:PK beta-barrel-protein domain-containing protein-like protein [Mollisia scopiformis]|uniref:PK beta-barrel-protein domain-containing protein-like protein n=1 Tax=Mollisia scopiformis TaxID=149040 RepID=A0A132B694_MOLSC|nr:PK beta-barrel-protein domain-containing protein-like protein [Mollisia scopiformis]KUJ07922.1 PK beta-barrel-protein domain-containing protein-like protein [Mollisia scopiformis]